MFQLTADTCPLGTRYPTVKNPLTNVKDIKRYVKVVTIAPDGLLVVKRE